MHQTEGHTELISEVRNSRETSTYPELSLWLTQVAMNQDKIAFTQLFKFFAPRIKRFGIKRFNNESQANELVQETMSNVWRKARLYDSSKGAATTWVYAVMRNASFDQLRSLKSKPEQNLGDDIWPLEQALAEKEDDSMMIHDHLESKKLERLVEGLPVAQRVVVQGVYFQELSQEQMAQQLGIPIGTVKSRLRLALGKLRQHMGDLDND